MLRMKNYNARSFRLDLTFPEILKTCTMIETKKKKIEQAYIYKFIICLLFTGLSLLLVGVDTAYFYSSYGWRVLEFIESPYHYFVLFPNTNGILYTDQDRFPMTNA